MYSQKVLFYLENEKHVVSFFYLGRAQLLLPLALVFILEYLSTGDQLQLLSLQPTSYLSLTSRTGLPSADSSKNQHWRTL